MLPSSVEIIHALSAYYFHSLHLYYHLSTQNSTKTTYKKRDTNTPQLYMLPKHITLCAMHKSSCKISSYKIILYNFSFSRGQKQKQLIKNMLFIKMILKKIKQIFKKDGDIFKMTIFSTGINITDTWLVFLERAFHSWKNLFFTQQKAELFF